MSIELKYMVKYVQSGTFRINYANEGSSMATIGGHFEKNLMRSPDQSIPPIIIKFGI